MTTVNIRVSRVGALLGTAALLVSALVATSAPAQAADTGDIVLTVVDQYGRPTMAAVEAVDSNQSVVPEDGATQSVPLPPGVTHTWTAVPVDGYGFLTITPWSGINCFGISPCSPAPQTVDITPVVTLTAGSTGSYTAVVTVPTITGNATAGSTLAIQIPPGIITMESSLPKPPGGHDRAQQWTRGSTDIAGATALTYTTVPADGGNAVAARLVPSSLQLLFPQAYGLPVDSFTTNAITLARFVPAKTKTKVKLPQHIRAGDRVSLKVKVKAKGAKPDGTVTIKVGRSTVRKSLDQGSTFVNLPRLAAGTYKISVKYAGTDYFAKSKYKKKITVLK
jgi:hypothetical protein